MTAEVSGQTSGPSAIACPGGRASPARPSHRNVPRSGSSPSSGRRQGRRGVSLGRPRRPDQGMIGYLIEQELGNLLPPEVPFATILTMIEVDTDDPAFADPTKFVGPIYEDAAADVLAAEKGWVFKRDGERSAASSRRRCPSGSSRFGRFVGCSSTACSSSAPAVEGSRRPGCPTKSERSGASRRSSTRIWRANCCGESVPTCSLWRWTSTGDENWGTADQRRLDRATPSQL